MMTLTEKQKYLLKDNMDYKTKEYYRNEIKQISEKTKISELYIAKKNRIMQMHDSKPLD